MAKAIYYGSICIDNILPELVRVGSDGKGYLSVRIVELDEADQYGNVAFIAQSVRKEEQRQGVRYSLGNLKPAGDDKPREVATVNVEEKLAALRNKVTAPTVANGNNDLPF